MKKVYDYNILKHDFFDTAVADILRAIDGRALMGSFILSLCCIDYMGMAMNPVKDVNSREDFKKFIIEYMGAVNPEYNHISEELWAIRNSLIHVYGISKATTKMDIGFNFSHEHPEYHLQVIRNPKSELWLNLPEFLGELIAVIELFFRKNRTNDELLRTWYSKLLIIKEPAAYLERLDTLHEKCPNHKESHRYFTILDNEPPPPIEDIRIYICSKLKEKLHNI